MVKIVVDGMGENDATAQIAAGAIDAIKRKDGFKVVITGDEGLINSELSKYKYDTSRIEVVPASEVITGEEIPTKAVKEKKNSSLVVAMNMLKTDGDVGGLVSAGSTGAVLTAGVLMIGRIKGVSRPALCPGVPNVRGGRTLICDCGANVECKPINLVHFAVMADAYCKLVYGVKNPKIGLLSNGTEDHKGDPMHQKVNAALKQLDGINYVGNIEGRDLMYSDVDVVVSDGFTGNIALKSVEGCGKTVKDMLNKAFKRNILTKLSYLAARGSIATLKTALDYDVLGGALFVGMKKPIIKIHGTCRAKAVSPAIIQAYEAHATNLTGEIGKRLSEVDLEKITALTEDDA